jgi:hypothetical protein
VATHLSTGWQPQQIAWERHQILHQAGGDPAHNQA